MGNKKRSHISVNGKDLMSLDKGIVMGYDKDGKIRLSVVGALNYEDILDLYNTTLLHHMEHIYDVIKVEVQTDEQETVQKEEIYNRAVWGFSLVADKFYPEGKNNRFAGLTDEAILKAQNEILLDRQKNR